jgi:hypothetical protein
METLTAMPKSHSQLRRLNRCQKRSLNRPLFRSVGAVLPNHLTQALRAFGRAIRAHRRLMKLAPDLFDYGVVDYNQKCHANERAWKASWEPALRKAYGDKATDEQCRNGAETVQNYAEFHGGVRCRPRTRAVLEAIEFEQVQWTSWLDEGSKALRFFREHQRHRSVSFSQIVNLIDVGTTLGRLACGLETNLPPGLPDRADHSRFLADLKRAYPPKPEVPPQTPSATP